jgi:hypothetical protein
MGGGVQGAIRCAGGQTGGGRCGCRLDRVRSTCEAEGGGRSKEDGEVVDDDESDFESETMVTGRVAPRRWESHTWSLRDPPRVRVILLLNHLKVVGILSFAKKRVEILS